MSGKRTPVADGKTGRGIAGAVLSMAVLAGGLFAYFSYRRSVKVAYRRLAHVKRQLVESAYGVTEVTLRGETVAQQRNVRIAPSTATDTTLDADRKAVARMLPAAELEIAARCLRRKYGWALRLFDWLGAVRGQEHVYLEIVPVSSVNDDGVENKDGSP